MPTKQSPFYNYNPPSPILMQPPSYLETQRNLRPVSSLNKTSATSPHTLDTTPPNNILTQTLNPLFKLSKWIGIFPLDIDQDGWASFGVKTFPFLLYLGWLLVFIGLSAYYSPLYLQLMYSDRNQANPLTRPRESIHSIAKYLFVSGQFLAAAATFLVVPRLAHRCASLYNRLNAIITTLGERGGGRGSNSFGESGGISINLNFRRIYRTSRLGIGVWVLVVIASLYLWWKSFHTYFRNQFKKPESESDWKYYSVVGGALSLAVVIAGHVVPSFVFLGFTGVIRASYRTIYKQKLPKKLRARSGGYDYNFNVIGSRSLNLLTRTTSDLDLTHLSLMLDLFARLNTQVNRLSEIFGRYLTLELTAFFTSILTNAFSILTGFENGSHVKWETTVISIFINILWFVVICEAGEAVGREGWIVGAGIGSGNNAHNGSGIEGTWLITSLLDDEVRGVTAANYFRIKRSLATQVVGALVMYLIVMLQFKTTS